MNPNPDQSLAEVLRPVSDSLAAVPARSRALAARFVSESLASRPIAPPLWSLPRLDLRLQLQLSVSQQKTILVIFRKDTGTVPIFKSETRFGLSPLAGPLPPLPAQIAELPCRLVLPPFILGRGTEPMRLRVGPDAADVLEINGRVHEPEHPLLRFRDRPLDGELWPLDPFLGLTRTLRDWLAGGQPEGAESLVLPLTADEPREGRQILYQLLAGWRQAQAALAEAEPALPAAAPPTLADCLATPYGLTDFSSEVVLRVRPDGTLAKANDDDTAQLRLRVAMLATESGWLARITARPPDFLLEGTVFEAVRDEFAWKLRKDIEKTLAKAGVPAFLPEIQALIRSGGDCSMVLRVRRKGEEDTDLLVLTGELIGRRVALLLRGDFEFARDGSGRIEDSGDFKTLYAGPLAPEVPVLDSEAQQWLLRLAVTARSWMWVLP